MKTTKSMLDYIATCSKMSLESFELARLNDRANLRKQMIEILDELIEVDIQARVAEWVLVQRRSQDQLQTPEGQLRHPPQHAHRHGPLQGAGASVPRLPTNEVSNADGFPELSANPVMSALREAVLDAPAHLRRSDVPAATNPVAHATVAVPAPVADCRIAEKAKRIA
jgi:hypothetical protein